MFGVEPLSSAAWLLVGAAAICADCGFCSTTPPPRLCREPLESSARHATHSFCLVFQLSTIFLSQTQLYSVPIFNHIRCLPLELNGTGTLPVSPVLEISGSLLFFHRILKLVRPCFHFHRILNIESGSIRDNNN